ncbi:polyribonucleotide nucleotidyltransferase, putative [Prunus dulcis]|uniref:polyribonucleotide nucleotidyltransferase n=1 Tax=Prunus dulcis TaxID=3755 RepID=A0A4Y1R8C6_PRUDU|nr:polyribonucleotide nucleotidyltransferase, putative [Prunus dulcis]
MDEAREISEKDLEAGLRLAHPEAVKYIEPQIKLAAKAGKHKKEYKLSMMPDRTLEKVGKLAEAPIEAVFTDPTYGKFERGEALENIMQDVKKVLEEECDEESLRLLPKAVDTVRKKVVRRRIIAEGFRLDGRRLDEVRPLYCEAGNLPMLHGSSLFNRGDTQVLCTVTLGAPGDAQRLESIVGPPTKRFMLHYSFPPFCINEVGKRGGLNRREVGHGTLAEKALLAVLPPEDDFPYTVRINSEVMASDGSTSMATVCGGSMALMDAGIPLREHVAGVSVGLVSEVDQSTGSIKDYRILTDILGLEDHLGDMDFKIAGTQRGITAIQLDIKPAGIPLDIICESLEPARKGRIQILDHMEREISVPRTQDDRNSPRLATLKYSNDALRRLLGPLGALKRKIEDETGARISVSDGTLTIVAKNQSVMEKVLEKVDFILGREIEIGGIYKGRVSSIKEYGAFVEFNGGQQGLLHISELSHEPVSRVSDVVSIGQQLSLICIGQDVRGNIKLSLKATLPRPRSETNNVVEESVSSTKEAPSIWASAGDLSSNGQQNQSSISEAVGINASTSSPPILIRSAAECDEEEKSAALVQNSKATTRPVCASETDHKPITFHQDSSVLAKPGLLQTINDKMSKSFPQKEGDKTEVRSPVTAKTLKIGTKVTAKVYQIRTGGLVLDLGGGIRGMYRFETNGKNDFEVDDELRVVCVSFSSKGIPVMSLEDDE